jgi:hypothetical protein
MFLLKKATLYLGVDGVFGKMAITEFGIKS